MDAIVFSYTKGGLRMVFTKEWFHAAGIRALKTMAQTAVATIGSAAVMASVDWKMVV